MVHGLVIIKIFHPEADHEEYESRLEALSRHGDGVHSIRVQMPLSRVATSQIDVCLQRREPE